MTHVFTCHQCGQDKTHTSDTTTGYALDREKNKICFDCCGINDAKDLKELPIGKKKYLYLDEKTRIITNWPGTFKFQTGEIKISWHKVPRAPSIRRYDTWFVYDGQRYHGVQYGDNTTIVHIRRLKAK